MILMSREFDLGLVKWLRTMVYNFIDQYSDLKIEDAFEMFLMNDLDSKFFHYLRIPYSG